MPQALWPDYFSCGPKAATDLLNLYTKGIHVSLMYKLNALKIYTKNYTYVQFIQETYSTLNITIKHWFSFALITLTLTLLYTFNNLANTPIELVLLPTRQSELLWGS